MWCGEMRRGLWWIATTFSCKLAGVPHPSPAKAKQFVEIDERSASEAILVRTERTRHR
jgi:hypothetical protein